MPDDRLSAVVPARVEIVAVAPGEMTTLRNLFQFYEYDFSEIEGAAIGDDGRFHQLEHAEFERAYFVRADGALAGFALVNRRASRVIDGEAMWSMQEFFIMRRYRRASAGRHAAHAVIERHPGVWEVTQTPTNRAALAFWRAVLAPYGYTEHEFNEPKWGSRNLQRFSTR